MVGMQGLENGVYLANDIPTSFLNDRLNALDTYA